MHRAEENITGNFTWLIDSFGTNEQRLNGISGIQFIPFDTISI